MTAMGPLLPSLAIPTAHPAGRLPARAYLTGARNALRALAAFHLLGAILIFVTSVGALCAPETALAEVFSNNANGPIVVLPDRLLHGGMPENVPIDISFASASDTSVDPGSLRIWVHKFFGWIDLTNKLRSDPRAHITARGIRLDPGMLPAGDYQVWVSLRDTKGRLVDATGTVRVLTVRAE